MSRRHKPIVHSMHMHMLFTPAPPIMLMPTLSRRAFAVSVASLLAAAPPTRRAVALSNEEALKLEAWSRTAEGTLLPSGVRVIDVLEGTGPAPSKGERV